MLFCGSSVLGEIVPWKTLNLIVPDAWKSKKTPMPSVGGYYLHSKIDGKDKQFFIHAHKPDAFATKSGSERYFKEFVDGHVKGTKFKCKHDHENYGYHCHAIFKKDKTWSIKMMVWYQDKERLLLSLEEIASKGEAQSIYKQIKVGFP